MGSPPNGHPTARSSHASTPSSTSSHRSEADIKAAMRIEHVVNARQLSSPVMNNAPLDNSDLEAQRNEAANSLLELRKDESNLYRDLSASFKHAIKGATTTGTGFNKFHGLFPDEPSHSQPSLKLSASPPVDLSSFPSPPLHDRSVSYVPSTHAGESSAPGDVVDNAGGEDTEHCEAAASPEVYGNPDEPEFNCDRVYPNRCNTGQYTLAVSRKMVSDYFGRNKKETKMVEDHRWIRSCRKHYQRMSYQPAWSWHKGKIVIRQLKNIIDQQPDVRFIVGLKTSEEKRLQDYYSRLVSEARQFDAQLPETKDIDEKEPDQAPLAVLHALKELVRQMEAPKGSATLSGGECEALVNTAMDMVRNNRSKQLPEFEMVPQWSSLKKGKAAKRSVTVASKGRKLPAKKQAGTKRKGESSASGANKRQKI